MDTVSESKGNNLPGGAQDEGVCAQPLVIRARPRTTEQAHGQTEFRRWARLWPATSLLLSGLWTQGLFASGLFAQALFAQAVPGLPASQTVSEQTTGSPSVANAATAGSRSTATAGALPTATISATAGAGASSLTANSGGAWRRIGTAAIDFGLPALGTGPMNAVRILRVTGQLPAAGQSGVRTFARTSTGQWFASADGERWLPAPVVDAEPGPRPTIDREPEPNLNAVRAGGAPGLVYAAGSQVWRSEDNGKSWANLTQVGAASLLGGPAFDVAVSPENPEEIAVATVTGVWKSMDGGKSWSGWNGELPHLPIRRIVSLPRGREPLRVALLSAQPWQAAQLEWLPGERQAWRNQGSAAAENAKLLAWSTRLEAPIRVVRQVGNWLYAGSSDGRLWASLNGGTTWIGPAFTPGASIEAIAVDPENPRIALAAASRRADVPAVRSAALYRTINGGLSWDEISGDLEESSAWGVAADFRAGHVYLATLQGVREAAGDLRAPTVSLRWGLLPGPELPGLTNGAGARVSAPVVDVMLDSGANHLYAAVYGYGVYQTLAPHRRKQWRIVHSSDYESRPAAPGSLLSVLGGKLDSVLASGENAPILSANESESQIQLPFQLEGEAVELRTQGSRQSAQFALPLRPSSPSIFVDRDGTPLILDAESGTLLDAENPARAGSVIQIMASGLGRVTPDLPAGMPAPVGQEYRVQANVQATLDGVPLSVRKAVLAPGYIGFYLIEVQLPSIVNRGTGILSIQAGNSISNLVHLQLEP